MLFLFSECVYPSLAPTIVNGQIHFTFQEDGEPGIFVWAGSQAEVGSNNIRYMSVDTDELTGIGSSHTTASGMEVSQNYPNPFNDLTTIEVQLDRPSDVVFTVADVSGRNVYRKIFEKKGTEKLLITFKSQDLTSGIYYYTVDSGSGTFTGKMIIQ